MLNEIEKLQEIIGSLPGIGHKSALRISLHLINMNNSKRESFLSNIKELSEKVLICECCHSYTLESRCLACNTPYDGEGILCVIETIDDMLKISEVLPKGSKFHILGGKLSPLNGVSPDNLNIDSLTKRVDEEGLKEIIIATGSDVEGETTASYLLEILKEIPLKKSRLAFGISVGSSLSNSDARSIQKSLAARVSY